MQKLAKNIKSATTLHELLDALIAFENAVDANAENPNDADIEGELSCVGVDICVLPTFGGDQPSDTFGVWSWDDDCLLVGEGAFNTWEIQDRDDA